MTSLLALQDTPAAKLTYTAAVTVPTPLRALMSAVPQEDSQPSSDSSGTHTFRFKQDVPIPSYLLALAVGELEHRQIGPRSKVGSFLTMHRSLTSPIFGPIPTILFDSFGLHTFRFRQISRVPLYMLAFAVTRAEPQPYGPQV